MRIGNRWVIGVAMLGAALAANAVAPAPSKWDGCAFQNVSFDYRKAVEVDAIAGQDYCYAFPGITGTLHGTFISCGLNADFVPSADVFGDGDDRFYAAKWYDIFETPKGRLFGTERGFYDFETGIQASVYTITGGDGIYAGVTGELTFHPFWSKDGLVGYGRGYICPAK